MVQADQLEKIAEGREAEVYAWEPGSVLRLFRDGRSAESLERETAVMEAAGALTSLVPKVYGQVERMGRPGIIMERIDGPDLMSSVGEKPWTIWQAGRTCGEVHAQLHEVTAPPQLEPLKSRAQRLAEATLIPAVMREWALRRVPGMPDGDKILHGDFHPANILMSSRGPIVIDWPNATAGDPAADVARTLLMFKCGSLPPGTPTIIRVGAKVGRGFMRAGYLRGYRSKRALDMEAVDAWFPLRAVDRLTEGIEDERETLLEIIGRAMSKT